MVSGTKWKPEHGVVIKYGDTTCKFVGAYPKTKLVNALKTRVPGYRFMPSYTSGRWDGYVCALKPNGTFPTGLLPRIYHILRQGFDPIAEESVPIFTEPINVVFKFEPEAKNSFHTTFLNVFEDKPTLHFDRIVRNQTDCLDLNSPFIQRLLYRIQYSPNKELPGLKFNSNS